MVTPLPKSTGNLKTQAWLIACEVPDPEIPAVNLGELGIVRDVEIDANGIAIVKLTPTYSGCPAVQVIEDSVSLALEKEGIPHRVERVISPPWTTDWISEIGSQKLKDYGIAPPKKSGPEKSCNDKPRLFAVETPQCPKCDSDNTKLISQFGSTPCKAHYQCENCMEPFDYFKCI